MGHDGKTIIWVDTSVVTLNHAFISSTSFTSLAIHLSTPHPFSFFIDYLEQSTKSRQLFILLGISITHPRPFVSGSEDVKEVIVTGIIHTEGEEVGGRFIMGESADTAKNRGDEHRASVIRTQLFIPIRACVADEEKKKTARSCERRGIRPTETHWNKKTASQNSSTDASVMKQSSLLPHITRS